MPRLTRWLCGLAFVATLAAYAPVLRAAFVNWDDGPIIVDNPHIRSLSWESLRWMFAGSYRDTYEPLAWLLFAAIHALQGLNPFGFHAASLFLHAANAALFFLVLLELLGGGAKGREAAAVPALLGALLFSLHPLQAEIVGVASSLADLLAAFFFLASVLAYLRAAPAFPARRRGLAASWLLFAASGLSRWKGVGLPAALLALDFFPLRRLPADPRAWLKGAPRRALLEKLPFFAVSAAIVLVNAHAKSSADGYTPVFLPAAWTAGLVFYPLKWLVPTDLLPFYRLNAPAETLGFPPLAAAALAALAGVWLILGARRRPWALTAAAVYLAGIGPTLGMAANGELFAHDRYAYLALLGLPALAAAALLKLGEEARAPAAAAAAVLLVGLGGVSRAQVQVWRDGPTLWRQVLAREPSATYAQYRLGLALVREGQEREAAAIFREQSRKSPEAGRKNLAYAYSQLGVRLYREGRPGEAVGPLTDALLLDPEVPENHANLAAALHRLGRVKEAVGHYETALALKPDARLHNALGVALVSEGRYEAAAERFALALELDPGLAEARGNLQALAGRLKPR